MPTVVEDYTALLSGNSIHGTAHKGAFYTFSFATQVPTYVADSGQYTTEGLASFRPLTDAEKDAARAAIKMFADSSGLTFFEVQGNADMVFGAYNLDLLKPGFAGFAYLPINLNEDALVSDVFLDTRYAGDTRVLLHEIGHAVGLKHPFEGDVLLDKSIDNFSTTVMSYTSDGKPVTALREMDVQAIQYLYGNASADGQQVASWSWDAATYTLTQTGFETADEIRGVATADVINGAGGDDRIYSDAGNDTIYGGAGNDSIHSGAGDDIVDGGIGNDTFFADGGVDQVKGGEGDDLLQLIYKDAPLLFSFDGGTGNDVLGVNMLGGVTSLSLPVALAGATLANVEKIIVFGNNDGITVTGSSGVDQIQGGDGVDHLAGDGGNDIIFGGGGADELNGDAGNDTIYGGAGDDTIAGGIGNDTIFSDGGLDHVHGGEGDDIVVVAYTGAPLLFDVDGEAGFDVVQIGIAAGLTAPVLSMPDTLAAGAIAANVERFLILGNANDNTITGSSVSDQIETGNGADTLSGGDGDDIFISRGGADTIRGGAGSDNIQSGDGADTIIGGSGLDFITGGAGADKIVYLAATDSDAAGRDQIYGFENGIDKIDITALKLSEAQVSTVINSGNTFVTAGALSFWVMANTTFSKADIKFVNDPVVTTLEKVGTNGGLGAFGGDNGPGAGGVGGSGEAASLLVGELAGDVTRHTVSATGGNGGTGGEGWFRYDVQEFDDFGGPGGQGGAAGAADAVINGVDASASLIVAATGGKGGDGGDGGGGGTDRETTFDPDTGPNMIEKNGGDGGIGGNGAHGGDAAAKITDSTLTLAQFATYELRAVAKGGTGGAGGEGGSGGHGGMTFDPFYEYPGGEGAPGGFAGNGGNAEARIENNDIAISATQLLVYAQAGGGAGGKGGTAGWDEKHQWDWDYIYPQPKSGGHAGSATAAIVGNDITGSDQVEAVTFDLSGVYALGGARGELREADPEYVTSTAGQNSSAALSLTGNTVALGGGNDSLTLRIAQHEGGSLTFSGNSFQGGAGNDTLVLDVSLLTAAGAAITGLTVNLAANNVTGFERIEGSAQNDIIAGDNSQMTIFGFGGNDQLTGGALNDTLNGGEGNDRLDGGAGNDQMTGGTGDDTYFVDNILDMAYEAIGEGTDTVNSSVTFFLGGGQYLENLTLTGTANINGSGNGLDNVLIGNSGVNTLDGSKGNDTLDGRGGADTLKGGVGDDLYIVGDAAAQVREKVGEGIDTVQASVTFSLAGQFADNLTLTGTDAINGTGNSIANIMTGNDANNQLRAGDGNDTLIGGGGTDMLMGEMGDDRYIVTDTGDSVVEADKQGTDTVESAVNFSLAGQFIENLTLTGSALTGLGNGLDNVLTGNELDNILRGGGGNDRLIGGAGNDTLMGEAGDDRYVIDNVGDKAVESDNGGRDTVSSSVSYSLAGQYIEDLELTGNGAINGTGNGLANSITGNDGANRIAGGAGMDVLSGGLGADIFVFDTALNGTTNVDRILDFNSVDDTIHLDREFFGRVTKGVLFASAFVEGTTALDSNDRIIYDSHTGNIFYDADGNGAGAAVQFATVNVDTVLTAADFLAF